jgi:hypothetical protein
MAEMENVMWRMGPNIIRACAIIWATRLWKRGSVSKSTHTAAVDIFLIDVCWFRISVIGVTVHRTVPDYGHSSAFCSSASTSPQETYRGYEATLIVASINLCHHAAHDYFWINRFTDTVGTIRINQLQTWQTWGRLRFVLLGCELHHSAIYFILL